jgi:hypothetical protein
MVLKNKDGKPYKLSSPCSVMSEMTIWDEDEKLILHNVKGTFVSNEDSKIVRNKEPQIVQKVEPQKVAPTPPPANKVQDKFDVDPIEIIDSLDKNEEEEDKIEKIQVWCWPFENQEGSKVRYGDRFIFEAVLEDMEDVGIILLATTDIIADSVIFPKTGDRRWWRVSKVDKSQDGLVRIVATITDLNPDFSSR